MKQRIAILGMGEIGSALAAVLKRGKHAVDAWDKAPGKVKGQKSLFEIVPKADLLFLCVPSWCLPDLVSSIQPFTNRKTTVVALSKGVLPGGKMAHEFLGGAFKNGQPLVFLGGAMLAGELSRGAPGYGAAASKNKAARSRVAAAFKGTALAVAESDDVRGTELCGILKNVYATGFGVLGGLDLGDNARGLYAWRAVAEMQSLAKKLGAAPATAAGFAGAADLLATGCSAQSRNVAAGEAMGKGKRVPPRSAEGAESAAAMLKLAKGETAKHPLFNAVCKIAAGKADAKKEFPKTLK